MIPFAVTSYLMGGDIQGREFVAPVNIKENGTVDKHSLQEQQLHQAPESESFVDNSSVQESNGSLLHTVHTIQEHLPPFEEPVREPQKHTYASIVCSCGSYFCILYMYMCSSIFCFN